MGYTHYYRGWVTLSESLVDDIRRIATASGVRLNDYDGTGEPVFEPENMVRLNGCAADEADYETFTLVHGVNHSDSLCKTGRRPYDVVVATILLRASIRSRRFKIKSDGEWNEDEWQAARGLYFAVFGELPNKPEGVPEISGSGARA